MDGEYASGLMGDVAFPNYYLRVGGGPCDGQTIEWNREMVDGKTERCDPVAVSYRIVRKGEPGKVSEARSGSKVLPDCIEKWTSRFIYLFCATGLLKCYRTAK